MSQPGNQISIQGNDLSNVVITSKDIAAEVNKDWCLCELRRVTFKLVPEDYRTMEVIIEMAREIRREAGFCDD